MFIVYGDKEKRDEFIGKIKLLDELVQLPGAIKKSQQDRQDKGVA